MSYISIRGGKNLKADMEYILKNEQTVHEFTVREYNGGASLMRDAFDLLGTDDQRYFNGRTKKISSSSCENFMVVLSFGPEDNITIDQAIKISEDFAQKAYGKNRPYIAATHVNGKNIHTHILLDARSPIKTLTEMNILLERTRLRNIYYDIAKELNLSNMYEKVWHSINHRVDPWFERKKDFRIKNNVSLRFEKEGKRSYTQIDRMRVDLRKYFYGDCKNATEFLNAIKEKGYSIKDDHGSIYIKAHDSKNYTALDRIYPGVKTKKELSNEIYYRRRLNKNLSDEILGKSKLDVQKILDSGSSNELINLQNMILSVHERYQYLHNPLSRLKTKRPEGLSKKEFDRVNFNIERQFLKESQQNEIRLLNDLKDAPDILKALVYSNTDQVVQRFTYLIEERKREEKEKEKENNNLIQDQERDNHQSDEKRLKEEQKNREDRSK